MGLVIFFDDYANCLLVGNTVRPLTDNARVSREKLSFLVDATAAPVASIAIISTWIGVELTEMKVPQGKRLLWHNAVVPLAGMMVIVVGGLYLSGHSALGGQARGADLREIFGAANSLRVLIWASFGGGLLAVGMSVGTRAIRLSEAINAWVVGCKSMVIAVIILVLAWTIGDVCRTHLQTGGWIISLVRPPANLMPLMFFLVSCLIAFATGTSFGTMAIVFPIAGPMLLAVTAGSDPGLARAITLATLSAVMSGAIFGVSPWLSLLGGTVVLVGILFVFGKRADTT